jgi:hypothetical protein
MAATDADLLYESTYLSAVGYFEAVLEGLLVEFCVGPRGRKTGHYALVKVRYRDAFRTVLLQGKKYVNVLPYKDFLETTKLYLNEGKPFTEIDAGDREILADAILIRNAIAHRSAHAVKRFRASVAGVTSLPAHRQYPGPLLRREYRAHPKQYWYELYFDTFEKVSMLLATEW